VDAAAIPAEALPRLRWGSLQRSFSWMQGELVLRAGRQMEATGE